MEAKNIPVIDFQQIEKDSQKLREASEEWGCFRLVNHGVPTKLMAEMKRVAKDLLSLPVEIKQRNKQLLPGSGYTSSSEESPYFEALGLLDMSSSHSVSSFCSQLEVSPQQRETINMYVQALSTLATDLVGKLVKSMGLGGYCFDGWQCELKLNKYNFTQECIGSTALQLHTDSGFLTILQDDEILRGLEVIHKDGNIVAVDPCPGTFLVNLGDSAVVWSNGRLHNVQHRVECKEIGRRYSMASFFSPPRKKILEAAPEFVDDKHPRLFRLFTYEEYRLIRASTKLHAGEALKLVLAE